MLGAGHVAHALVDALHEEHDVTVIDVDAQRLAALAGRYDVRTVEGDGTRKHVVRKAGVEHADLFVGCSPREEANLVCAMLVKRLSGAQTIIRTTSAAYLEAWREREIDVDFMVSPELETANAIAGDPRASRPRATPTCSPTARCRSSSSTCPPTRRTARSSGARCGTPRSRRTPRSPASSAATA